VRSRPSSAGAWRPWRSPSSRRAPGDERPGRRRGPRRPGGRRPAGRCRPGRGVAEPDRLRRRPGARHDGTGAPPLACAGRAPPGGAPPGGTARPAPTVPAGRGRSDRRGRGVGRHRRRGRRGGGRGARGARRHPRSRDQPRHRRRSRPAPARRRRDAADHVAASAGTRSVAGGRPVPHDHPDRAGRRARRGTVLGLTRGVTCRRPAEHGGRLCGPVAARRGWAARPTAPAAARRAARRGLRRSSRRPGRWSPRPNGSA
jgi:hypothetical protein